MSKNNVAYKINMIIFILPAEPTNIGDKKRLCFVVKQHALTGTTTYSIWRRGCIAKPRKVKLLFFSPFVIKVLLLHSMLRVLEF